MNCLFLVNPCSGSGRGKRIAQFLESDAFSRHISRQVVYTDPARIVRQVQSLAPDRDLVVIAGGDGTISTVTKGLARLPHPPPFAIIPIGTGNDLARATGWLRAWKQGGAESFFALVGASRVKTIDLWSCDDEETFICYLGAGLDAEIVSSFSTTRQKVPFFRDTRLNRLFFMAHGLRTLLTGKKRASRRFFATWVDAAGNLHELSLNGCGTLIAANTSFYGGGGRLAPQPAIDDGLLDIHVLPNSSAFISFFLNGRFQLTPLDQKTARRAKHLSIRREDGVKIHLDGSIRGTVQKDPFLVVQRARSLPVLIPPEDTRILIDTRKPSRILGEKREKACVVAPGPASVSRDVRPRVIHQGKITR